MHFQQICAAGELMALQFGDPQTEIAELGSSKTSVGQEGNYARMSRTDQRFSLASIGDMRGWARPSAYGDEPYLITRKLIEEGRNHLLLGGLIEPGCPVRILQGIKDPDVPWQHAVELVSRIARDDVVLTLVKDGDHRLSREEDLQRLFAAIEAMD